MRRLIRLVEKKDQTIAEVGPMLRESKIAANQVGSGLKLGNDN